jgi:redox-sensitive bicupin YhaK (pirin superfamily)
MNACRASHSLLSESSRSIAMPLERLHPHTKDIGGGFVVRRALPAAQRQAVGPFLFFDHFGPLQVQPDDHHDVRPHPHIGLATVTYLFEGVLQHRDSLGVSQRIEPGAINWMTAGRGIVHSERRPEDLRGRSYVQHGLQLWVALPETDEEAEPHFEHTPAAQIPALDQAGARLRVLVGSAHGLTSPVATRSPTLFIDHALDAHAECALPAPTAGIERALYSVDAPFDLVFGDGTIESFEAHTLVVLPDDCTATLRAGAGAARVALVGGAPLGHRHMAWNFVSSRRERISAAADAWECDALGQVPGETERIPLPPALQR